VIVTLLAVVACAGAKYYSKPNNLDELIQHMQTLPNPCTHSQFENLADELSFKLELILGTDDWFYWEIERDEKSLTPHVLHTEFRIVDSKGDFLLGDWRIVNNERQLLPWDGEQIWPKIPKQ